MWRFQGREVEILPAEGAYNTKNHSRRSSMSEAQRSRSRSGDRGNRQVFIIFFNASLFENALGDTQNEGRQGGWLAKSDGDEAWGRSGAHQVSDNDGWGTQRSKKSSASNGGSHRSRTPIATWNEPAVWQSL